jgi:putative two-component system response regulator
MSTQTKGLEQPPMTAPNTGVPSARILVVDDELFVREILVRKLQALGYVCDSSADGRTALKALSEHPYDLLLTDIMMPEMNGVDLIKEATKVCPELAVILVTSVIDLEVAIDALKLGAYDYITKPFSLEEVTIAVARAIEKRKLVIANLKYQETLEEQVASRTRQLREALDALQSSYHSTLVALGTALDSRDADKGCHSYRVTLYSTRIARQMGLGHKEIRSIEQGALLHDIGKIGVPDDLLRKPERLTDSEWALMRRHPEIGFRILSGIKFLQGAAQIVLQHHERYDGLGYPKGLDCENIIIGARIFALADAFDSMTSDRPFQVACSFEAGREEIRRCAGRQFDPGVVEAFLQIPMEEWQEIRRTVSAKMDVVN